MICSRVISRSYAIKERITPVSIQLVCPRWVMHAITHHGEERNMQILKKQWQWMPATKKIANIKSTPTR